LTHCPYHWSFTNHLCPWSSFWSIVAR